MCTRVLKRVGNVSVSDADVGVGDVGGVVGVVGHIGTCVVVCGNVCACVVIAVLLVLSAIAYIMFV